ncbi:MAG: VWA domain-containing protein [Anaerolineaceae bacterium]|nr:VWA domain-containing protein [Anaerolineaceae bacterium]MCB9098114.1 VWA domain-containing protein [Anaerolineales bacterium]
MSEPDTPPDDTGRPAPDQVFAPGHPFALKQPLPSAASRRPQPGRGRRSQATATHQGGFFLYATTPTGPIRDIALAATLRAAALRLAQTSLSSLSHTSISNLQPLTPHPQSPLSPLPSPLSIPDLRVKVRRVRTGNLILFVVDASGSMGARKRMIAVKGAMLSLLLDAYQKRDRVGLITFRGQSAHLLVPPTNSVELAERQLRQLPTGGRTPLPAGLQLADQVLTNHLKRDSALTPLLVLITDGRVTSAGQLQQIAVGLAQKKIAALVLDSEQGFVRLGLARQLAQWLGAHYLLLDELQTETIVRQVRSSLG